MGDPMFDLGDGYGFEDEDDNSFEDNEDEDDQS